MRPATCVIAIDPGRKKCGLALVDRDGRVLRRLVAVTEMAVPTAQAWQAETGAPVALGAGTAHAALRAALEAAGMTPRLLPEQDTTRRARERYFAEHPPRGWRRLVPRGLLAPPEPVDDYAAILIAEAYFAQEKSAEQGN